MADPVIKKYYYPIQTSDSTSRLPTPPRITIPPPTLNADALPEISLNVLRDSPLLNSVHYNKIITQNAVLQWKYEQRREAQMLLPYLYLGPITAAKDEAWLKKEGITCIFGIRQKGAFATKLMDGALRKAQEIGLEHHSIELGDNQELIKTFPAATFFIHSHVSRVLRETGNLGKVLVFCESGNERSAGICAAYLMETHEDVDYIKAMQLTQNQRFCVNFDDGVKRLLQGYWDIIRAKRQTDAQSNQYHTQPTIANGVPTQAPTTKRARERDDDVEMEGVDEDDLTRFGGRTFVPFVDFSETQ